MSRKLYFAIIIGSGGGAILAIVLASAVPNPWQLLSAGLSGALASLAASTVIQSLASAEQDQALRQIASDQEAMIRSITLSVSGIHAIPRDFLSLQWIAYTTQVASNDADKSAVGRFSPLRKVRVVGKHLVEYELLALNPSKREVPYNCTFIGLENCVVGIIAKDGETTSVIVIDAPVPDVEYYFGAGYVTTWLGGRSTSFQVVGTTALPKSFRDFPVAEQRRFNQWFGRVEWNVRDAHSLFAEQ